SKRAPRRCSTIRSERFSPTSRSLPMPSPSRREFIASSAATLSAATYTGAADMPSERVRLAVMGVRSRGKDLIRAFAALPNVEISHVIDPDESKHADAVNLLKKQDTPPKVETD